jgi:hypothetical protein
MSEVLSMRQERKPDTERAVIASAPIVATLHAIRSDIAGIRRWSPNNEVATALELMCEKMDRALREAQRTDVWLTVDQVAELSNRPPSTITRICRDDGADAGAHKVKGAWSIHWPTFEAFVMKGQTQNTQEAA